MGLTILTDKKNNELKEELLASVKTVKRSFSKKPSFTTNRSVLLKKHINLINCSQSQLSLRSQKIYNALLFCATSQMKYNPETQTEDPSTASQEWFTVDSSELKELIGVVDIRKTQIGDHLQKLSSASYVAVSIREDLGKEMEEWSGSNLVSEWRFLKNKYTNDIINVEFKLPDLIRKNIVYPKIYGNLDLTILNKYKSRYSYSLDPFLRVNFLNYNFSRVISLEDYRMVIGVPEEAFDGRNDNLLNKALKTPLKEVKSKNPEMKDIIYKIVKKGRSIIGIEFSKLRTSTEVKSSVVEGLSELIHKFNYQDQVITKLRTEYGDEKLYTALQYTYQAYLKRKSSSKPIDDLKSYAYTLLSNDFDNDSTLMEQESQIKKDLKKIEAEASKSDRDLLTSLTHEHQSIIKVHVFDLLRSLTTPERDELLTAASKVNGDALFDFSWDEVNGFSNQIAESNFVAYVAEHQLDKDVTDFGNYVFNRTGRPIKAFGPGNIYKFISKEKVVTPKKTKAEEVSWQRDIDTFIKDYKLRVAKILSLSDSMRDTLLDKYLIQVDKEDTVQASELLIEHLCKVKLKKLGLKEICALNKAKAELTENAFNIKQKNEQAEGANALVLLHSFMPKNEVEIMSLIVQYI